MKEHARSWVISDTRFGHANIILHAVRPFRSVTEMDETPVANWNAVVGDDDTVYHLGDFSGPPMNRKIERIAERLRGRIVLITGNHDRVTARMATAFARVTGPQRVQVPGNRRWGLLLSHLPAHAAGTDEPRRKTVMGNLHGHIHQRTSPTRGTATSASSTPGTDPSDSKRRSRD